MTINLRQLFKVQYDGMMYRKQHFYFLIKYACGEREVGRILHWKLGELKQLYTYNESDQTGNKLPVFTSMNRRTYK